MTLEAEIQLWNDQQRLDQTIIAELTRVQAKKPEGSKKSR